MKLTKDEQIELLNESIQQLMQENTELKATLESLRTAYDKLIDKLEETQDDSLHSYKDGYDEGYSDAKDYESYE
jgi:regulator of replication initiation timing